jgi:hypothetical protein
MEGSSRRASWLGAFREDNTRGLILRHLLRLHVLLVVRLQFRACRLRALHRSTSMHLDLKAPVGQFRSEPHLARAMTAPKPVEEIRQLIPRGGIDNCDGDRHLYAEAGGQKHTQWLAPVSRAASPYPPFNRAYCDGVRRHSMMKLAPSALSLR